MMSQYIEGLDSEPVNDAQVRGDKKLVEEYEKVHGIVIDCAGERERIEQKINNIRKRIMPKEPEA